MNNTKDSCSCDVCKSFCKNRVGWFLPGEPEKVAEFLEITLKELFNKKLGVDWWVADENIFVIAPAIKSMSPGNEFPANPSGCCIFFNKKGLCDIHPVKPFECKKAFHNKSDGCNNIHKDIAKAWENHQKQIIRLLEREPIAKEFSIFDAFDCILTQCKEL